MKQKGRIILVTMLAVFFLASTVHAGNWWGKAAGHLWSKLSKMNERIAKVEYQSNWTAGQVKIHSKQIKNINKKLRNHKDKMWKKKAKKKKKRRHRGKKYRELKAQIIAELKSDAAFMEALKGEKGDKGDPGEKGEDGDSGTFISHWESLTNYNHEQLNLSGVNLKKARVLQSYLHDVNLRDAKLVGAHLDGSSFSKYSWDSPGCDMSGADLTNATVVGTDFSDCDFSGAILTGVDLNTAANLAGAIWTGATCPDGQLAEVHGGSCEGVSP